MHTERGFRIWEAGVILVPICNCFKDGWLVALLQVLLDLDPFLNELTKLYEQTKNSGTVWVTLKRCN